MARKGFWKGGINLLQELDRVAATTVYNGPKRVAERVVREMQQAGPSWTGKFSNSWEIQTPATSVRGSGQPGEPRPLYTPPLTGIQVTKSFLTKESIVFRISNFSPHALEAIDAVQHDRQYYARRLTAEPQTALGRQKWELNGPRSQLSYRGQTGGGSDGANSSRTAPLDWFATYASSNLGRAVQVEMDSAFTRRFT
jgi:hypothetical protein